MKTENNIIQINFSEKELELVRDIIFEKGEELRKSFGEDNWPIDISNLFNKFEK